MSLPLDAPNLGGLAIRANGLLGEHHLSHP
jgi:hypothetical protein